MKIAITGASGQFGRAAVEALMARMPAADLILVSRTPAKLADFAARGAICRRGDFDQPETLRGAFAGARRMLLISGTRVGKRVAQHRAAIEAGVADGVRHIAYTSFVGIDDRNPALVVKDHGPTEALIKASGAAWTMLRDSWYADAIADAIAPNAIAAGRWISSSGAGRAAMVAREDCVACAVAVLTGAGHENRTYNITGPDLLSVREAVAMISDLSGKPIEYVETDDAGMYAMFDAMGVPREPVDGQAVKGIPWNSDDMVSFERAIREGWLGVVSDDVERITGRKPKSLRKVFEERRARWPA